MEKEELTTAIKRRLKRIEGQVKGIERMIDEDCCCMDILVQISAVRAATSKVGVMILENYANRCLSEAMHAQNSKNDHDDSKEKLENLMNVISNFIK